MSERPSLVISDVHWGALPPEEERAFLEFLRTLSGSVAEILFNGDLFDFWFEYRSAILGRYFPLLRRLAELRDAGVRLALIGGNHDAWGGRFLREVVGMEVREGPARVVLAGWRVWAAHGDGLGDGDLGYRLVKRVLRQRTVVAAARWVHPDWLDAVARRLSKTRPPTARDRARSDVRADALRRYARERLAADPTIDVVLLGHCHVPEVTAVAPRRYYVNAGDWWGHRSYVEFRPDRVELRSWRGPGPASG